MSNHPTGPPGATGPTDYPPEWWAEHPVIDLAEAALIVYAGRVDRATAEILLPYWRYAAELSARERAAVLDRFGPVPAEVEGTPLGYRDTHGWTSGSMGTEEEP